MSATYLRQLCLLHLVWCLGCWKVTEANPRKECEHGIVLTKGPGIQTDVGDMWRDQNEQQVQNVFKRFLFHYSKANSVGSIQHAAFPSLVPFSAPIDAPVTKTVSEEKEAAPAFEAPGSP
ncbi:uncharacterized protein LOC118366854 isoform X1 [Oncorhynchus keta]|uniref:uncharacterized protein LOC118366854 isoform X1 n=1 Tax=Oncorhynchus keta TaxID=8018 RepID=UPI0015FCF931|nr:uncharacterized protein LOC118366854 isoform X1 [Oncorhynchus keta]